MLISFNLLKMWYQPFGFLAHCIVSHLMTYIILKKSCRDRSIFTDYFPKKALVCHHLVWNVWILVNFYSNFTLKRAIKWMKSYIIHTTNNLGRNQKQLAARDILQLSDKQSNGPSLFGTTCFKCSIYSQWW